jgi:DNA (cytosine-5)-methyltransferase 1
MSQSELLFDQASQWFGTIPTGHPDEELASLSEEKVAHVDEPPQWTASEQSARTPRKFSVVSMFSGCGGMDLGFKGGFALLGRDYDPLPFEIVWANEHNQAACRTYRKNLGVEIRCEDVWTALDSIPAQADVLIGGFPCQDVSVNGKREGVNGKRTGLYKAMIEGIKRAKPKVFVAENVKGLLMKDDGASIRQVVADFEELGYKVSYQLQDAANFGVPQTRERVIIVGVWDKSRSFAHPAPLLAKASWVTAKAALGDLESREESPEFNHIWSRANKSGEQGNRKLVADRPGYTIRAECHGNIQYHYSLKRRISMREAARIQSFPDSFIFDAKLRETERQIGNAVPPVLAWHVARAVERYLTES